MPEAYFPLDVNFFDHPKVVGLDDATVRLYLSSVAYANRFMTDGFVADAIAGRLIEWDWNDPDAMTLDRCAAMLEQAVLWHRADAPCPRGHDETCPKLGGAGWRIHDFLDHNRSRETRESLRDKERDRKAAYRQRQRDEIGRPTGSPTDVPRHQMGHVPGNIETETETDTGATAPGATRASRSGHRAAALVAVADTPDPPPETAQTILAAYIDWRRTRGVNGIDRRTTGLLAKQLGEAFTGGHDPQTIRLGLADWDASDCHPSTLGSFIDTRARGGQPRASPGKGQRQLQDMQRTHLQMLAMDPPEGDPSDLGRLDRHRGQAQRELP
jgi:hypothetical protein